MVGIVCEIPRGIVDRDLCYLELWLYLVGIYSSPVSKNHGWSPLYAEQSKLMSPQIQN